MADQFDLAKLQGLVTDLSAAHDSLVSAIAANTEAQQIAVAAAATAAARLSDQAAAQASMNTAIDAVSAYVESLHG